MELTSKSHTHIIGTESNKIDAPYKTERVIHAYGHKYVDEKHRGDCMGLNAAVYGMCGKQSG